MNLLRQIISLTFLCILIVFSVSSLSAQRTIEGTPISFSKKYKSVFPEESKTNSIPALNLARIKAEDKAKPTNRFAAPVDVDFDLKNDGDWYDLDDGGRVWKLKIKAEGALGLYIFYKNFYLPNGARLYVYDENQEQLLGAYTNLNNNKSEKFMTGMISGETAILEYYEPSYAKHQGRFEIYQVMQAYEPERIQSDYEFKNYRGFGDGLPCHENINCSWGDDLQDQKRGVVRMLTVYNAGMGWCTGSMINNTNNDGKPYVLSANHCGFFEGFIADFTLWRFDYEYEFPTCANSSTEPGFVSLLGADVISHDTPSDFLLLELYSNVPSTYNTFFNGWDREEELPAEGNLIHHPFGDVKKITVDSHELESHKFLIIWSDSVTTPPHSHYRSILDIGTIEGGSSGSPLFDDNGRIVGQLHGGDADCSQFITYDGKLSYSWDEGDTPESRLLDWLDPISSGVLTLDGIENPALTNSANIFGEIRRENGTLVPHVEMQITSDTLLNIDNQSDGSYELLDLNLGNNFLVKPYRNENHKNGVNTIDMVLMRKHILGIGAPLSPYQIIAGDVDRNGFLNTIDLVKVQKIILEWDTEFSNSNSWRFIPADYVFTNPSAPLNESFPELNVYLPLLASMPDQDFIAIKVGDLNNSANVNL